MTPEEIDAAQAAFLAIDIKPRVVIFTDGLETINKLRAANGAPPIDLCHVSVEGMDDTAECAQLLATNTPGNSKQ